MSREDDWKIHEYMGNDLTGWDWYFNDETDHRIIMRDADGFWQHSIIPHYSTTGDGMLLVMEWLEKESIPHTLKFYNGSKLYWAQVNFCGVYDDTAPLALAKAVKGAMEERENG